MLAARTLLLVAVATAFASEADAQRWYRRRAFYVPVPTPSVAVSPGGVSVRTPFYSFSTSPGPYGGAFYSGGYGWPGVSVSVQGRTVTTTPTPAAGPYDPAPGDESYSAPATAGYNLLLDDDNVAPLYEPTSATRAGLEGELSVAHAALNARLDLFNGGDGWQKYLALGRKELTDPEKIDRVLRRMDSVAADPQFEAVSSLGEFRRVHELLKAVAAEDASPAPPAELDAPPAAEPIESLPTPRPDGASGMAPPPEPQPPAEPAAQRRDASGERSVLTN